MNSGKRIGAVFLVMIFIFTSYTVVFGEGLIFTDIKDHWAKEYIEDIYNRKITFGYEDATFRPNNHITGLESAIMIANLLGYNAEKHDYIEEYQNDFASHHIPQWAQGHMAYLIKKNVILREELNKFVTGGQNNLAKRYEVVNYIGRLLVYHGEQKVDNIVVLPYKDDFMIPKMTRPYADLLLNLGMLNKDSNNGNFLPNDHITRGEVAKLISLTAKIIDGVERIEEDETKNSSSSQQNSTVKIVEEKEGILGNMLIANRIILTIIDNKNEEYILDADKNAKVILDGKEANFHQLKKGQILQLKLVNNVIEEIRATTNTEIYEVYFVRFLRGNNNVLTVKNKRGEIQVFVLANDVKVTLDGKEDSLANFKEGDILQVYANSNYVLEVEGESKTKYIRGTISDKGPETEPFIEVTTNDDGILSVPLTNITRINRDGKLANYSELKVGDQVTLELEYNHLTTVTAQSVKRRVQGQIKRIVIGEESYLTVQTSNQIQEEFKISDDTIIKIDDEMAEIYDLRLHYRAELNIESSEIVSVLASSELQSERIIGTVTYIHKQVDVLTVQYEENGEIKRLQVNTNNETIYIAERGGRTYFRYIEVGDEILVVGKVNKGVFVAEQIIIIKKK